MIQAMARAFVSLLERQGAIRPEEREVYIYGCDIALYTIISTLALLAVGASLGRPRETVICVGIFYLNQSVGGGYHADTHLRCFITMAAGLLVFILSFSLPLPPAAYMIFGYLSLMILYGIPLVLHKNKSYLIRHREKLIRQSRLVILLQIAVFSLALIRPGGGGMPHAFGMTLTLCAVSRLAAKRINNMETST